jgi:hypothetical protein
MADMVVLALLLSISMLGATFKRQLYTHTSN